MANMVSFVSKNSDQRWGQKTPVVILLMGLISVLQVCYQAFVMSQIHEVEEPEQLQDACEASFGGEVSYQCLEQRVYQGWQEDARLEEQEEILQSTQMTGHEDHHKAHVERVVTAVAELAAAKGPDILWEEHRSAIHAAIEVKHNALPDGERENAKEIHSVHGDRLLDASLQAVHAKEAGDSIEDIKQRLLDYQLEHERHRQERAEKFRKEHEDRMKAFDRLYEETLDAIHHKDPPAADPSASEPKSDFDRLYEQTMAAIHAPTTPSPWAQHLEALQAQYNELSSKNGERQASRTREARRPRSSGFLASRSIGWHPVSHWKDAAPSGDAGLVIVGEEDLRALKWSGALPHVACIAMVPPGADAVYQMMYFVDNWRLQTWESKELVLVYQHSDRRLAKVLDKYVDGKAVKAVGARDAEFPSTAAARYGAWSVKADVIARWDFEEWHHPDQLTLQVKALAMTARPASLLQPQGTHGPRATDRESTLVGEAKWMREEWYPFLRHGSDILEEDRAHHIVQVDVPKLDINAKAPKKAPFKDTLEAERAEIAAGVAICLRLQQGEHFSEFTVSLGAMPLQELEKDHEHLAEAHRHTDVRLSDLCVRAGVEGSLLKRAELHRQAARLASFEAEIASELSDPAGAVAASG